MTRWVLVADAEQLPLDSGTEVVAEGKILAIFHTTEGYFAIDGMCAHQGGPVGRGEVQGQVVTCPWHGWQYDVRCGKHLVSSITLASYPVEIREGKVWVDLEATSA